MPARQPNSRAMKTPDGKFITLIRKKETNNIAPALIKVTLRSASEGFMFPKELIARIPITDAIKPTIATRSGRAMYSKLIVAIPAPRAIVAIMEPQ